MLAPASLPDLDTAAAMELAGAVRARVLSPRELLDEFLRRIAERNGPLNAVVALRADAARREADAQTRLLGVVDEEALPPLFGLPITIKECFATSGMPHTAGSVRRRYVVADHDASAVARLREAGAIVMGVTNVPEMAFWYETDNLVYGRTNNPFDVSRTVGGSSGGEGAALGGGLSPLGLGSDVGGSIRMPASFCGVFGHKPSGGLVAGTGHVPMPSPSLTRYTCYGPLARSARDLLPALRVLAGDDGQGPPELTGVSLDDVAFAGGGARGLDVHVIDECGWVAPSDAVRTAVWQAALALERLGARAHHARPRELSSAFAMWAEAMQQGKSDREGRAFIDWLGDGQKVSVAEEIARLAVGRPRHTKEALLFAALEKAGERLPIVRGGLSRREALRAKLRQLLPTSRHVILAPVFPAVAFPHGHGARFPAAFVYSGLWNVLEMPSTAVPLGLDGEGLPLGCQVIGVRGADAVTVAVAGLLERECGGRVPPRRGR